MYCQSNNWWRFRKILWPSQNIWTLLDAKKFGKLTGYTYTFNSLTNFVLWSACNDRKRKSRGSAEMFLEKIRELIFWRVLVVWNHSASFDGIYSRKVLSEQRRESAGAQRLHSNQFWRIFPPCLHSFLIEDRIYLIYKQYFAQSSIYNLAVP